MSEIERRLKELEKSNELLWARIKVLEAEAELRSIQIQILQRCGQKGE